MSDPQVTPIADAVLYEGYILYPYHPSSTKNQYRWSFGVVYPRSYAEHQIGADDWRLQTECLLQGRHDTLVEIKVRFLQVIQETVGELMGTTSDVRAVPASCLDAPTRQPVASMQVGGKVFHSRQDSVERETIYEAPLSELVVQMRRQSFCYGPWRESQTLYDENRKPVGVLVRHQESLEGILLVSARPCRGDIFKLRVRVENTTPLKYDESTNRNEAIGRSFVSTHMILSVRNAAFVSLLEPPADVCDIASSCENIGAWPVLVGDRRSRNVMLSSPIILCDYPQVAPESPGDLFDGTEIDGLLSLRVQTITDGEKREASAWNQRARQIVEIEPLSNAGPEK